MKILKQFTHGKVSDDSYNEDRFVIGEHAIGVIDGSRGPGYMKKNAIEGILDRACDLVRTLPENANAHDLVASFTSITAGIKNAYQIDEMRYSGGFHFVIYHKPSRQIWRVGDCMYRMNGQTVQDEIEIEFIAARQRAVMIHALLVQGQSTMEVMASDAYRDMFLPFFAPLLDFANNSSHKYGFGVINGLRVPQKFVKITEVSENCETLILSTDGYPKLFDSFEETEHYLERLMERDPLCINEFFSSKGMTPDQVSFDDRTFVKIGL